MNHLSLNIQQTGSAILIVVFGLAIMGYGVLSVLKPEWLWKLEHMGRRWMYEDLQPTDNGLAWMRIVGAFSIIGGIFFILLMLWLTIGRNGAI
jgi:hypothetical protein